MRITERRLRSIIKSIIKENIEEGGVHGEWTKAEIDKETIKVAKLLQCKFEYLYYLNFDENFEALKNFSEEVGIHIDKTDEVQKGQDGRSYVILEPHISPVPFIFSCGIELDGALEYID